MFPNSLLVNSRDTFTRHMKLIRQRLLCHFSFLGQNEGNILFCKFGTPVLDSSRLPSFSNFIFYVIAGSAKKQMQRVNA